MLKVAASVIRITYLTLNTGLHETEEKQIAAEKAKRKKEEEEEELRAQKEEVTALIVFMTGVNTMLRNKQKKRNVNEKNQRNFIRLEQRL